MDTIYCDQVKCLLHYFQGLFLPLVVSSGKTNTLSQQAPMASGILFLRILVTKMLHIYYPLITTEHAPILNPTWFHQLEFNFHRFLLSLSLFFLGSRRPLKSNAILVNDIFSHCVLLKLWNTMHITIHKFLSYHCLHQCFFREMGHFIKAVWSLEVHLFLVLDLVFWNRIKYISYLTGRERERLSSMMQYVYRIWGILLDAIHSLSDLYIKS